VRLIFLSMFWVVLFLVYIVFCFFKPSIHLVSFLFIVIIFIVFIIYFVLFVCNRS
jgi:hypothetical protein